MANNFNLQEEKGSSHNPTIFKSVNNGGVHTPVVAAQNVISSATPSNVAVTASSGIVLNANVNRADAVVTNYGTKSCFLARGATATVGQGIYLAANGGSYELDSGSLYRGVISAICASGDTTNLAVSEGNQ